LDDLDLAIDSVTKSPTQQPRGYNRLDDAIDDVVSSNKSKAGSVVGAASSYDPDSVAKARNMGRQVGLPADISERNPEEVKRRFISQQVEDIYDSAPVTGRTLSNGSMAKIAHDDIDNMVETENAIRSINSAKDFGETVARLRKENPFLDADSARAMAKNLRDSNIQLPYQAKPRSAIDVLIDPAKSFSSGANTMLAGITEASRYAPSEILFNKALQSISPALYEKRKAFVNDTQSALNDNAQFWQSQKSEDLSARIDQFNKADIGTSLKMLAADPALLVDQLSQSLPYLVPGGAAARTGATGTLTFNALMEAFDSANSARQTAIENGATEQEQDRAAGLAALVTAPIAFLGNKIPGVDKLETEFFTKGRPGHNLISSMIREAISGAAEEGGNQLGQNVGESTYNDAKDILEGVGKAAALGGVLESSQGVGMHALSKVMEKLGQIEVQSNEAEHVQETFSKINDLATQSMLKKRSAEDFASFIQDAGGENAVPDVFVDARTFNQSAIDAGADLNTLMQSSPAIGQQLQDAIENGTDLVIPVGEYAKAIAGTDLGNALLPHIRSSEDGLSAFEANTQLENAVKSLQEDANRFAKEQTDINAWEDSRKALEGVFSEQLNGIGRFTREQNSAYVKGLVSPFYSVLAGQLGITPMQAYERYPLSISGDVGSGNRLNQVAIDTPEFKNWFGDSKVVDAEGKPLVVYHGTGSDFNAFDNAKTGKNYADKGLWGKGHYFSAVLDNANSYALRHGDGANIIPTYVSIKSPLTLRTGKDLITRLPDGTDYRELVGQGLDGSKIKEIAISGGYDGVIQYKPNGEIGDLVAFSPEQIKSAVGNRGTFDPNDPNILHQRNNRTPSKDQGDTFLTAALEYLARDPELFQKSPSDSKSVADITNDIDPAYKALPLSKGAITNFFEQEDRPEMRQYKADRAWEISVPDSKARSGYIFVKGDKVWIDVSRLQSGIDGGNVIYGIAAAYAHNNGKKLIGDPAGLSRMAFYRRNENMLSSALKYGTTRHLEPHSAQIDPIAEYGNTERARGMRKLDWKEGDDVHNIRELMYNSWKSATDYLPDLKNIIYDADSGQFKRVDDGTRVNDGYFKAQASELSGDRTNPYRAGIATQKRAALFNTFLREQSGEEGRRTLGRLVDKLSRGELSPDLRNTFYQQEESNRGAITFSNDITSGANIALLKDADLSTFIHETGHFFLEVYSDLASRPDAPQKVRDDMNKILAWFGINDLDTWRSMDIEAKRPYHEKFARGFEQFTFEGKSPNMELRGLFQRFREFMISAYKSISDFLRTNGETNLTDEVRQVFDRMIATDEQIEQAQKVRGMMPVSNDVLGLSEEDYAKYLENNERATGDAIAELDKRSLRDLKWLRNARSKFLKDLQAQANGIRDGIENEIRQQVEDMPVYRARKALKTGELKAENGDDVKVDKGFKLNLEAVESMYPQSDIAPVNYQVLGYGKYGMLAKDGLHPDMVASIFGYQSGDQLVRELLSAEDPNSLIERLTDERMMQEHGDITDEASLQKAADEAVHNELRSRVIATELAAQAKSIGNRRIMEAAAKEIADNKVNGTKVKDLKPKVYDRAESKAYQAYEAAMRKGDTTASVRAKRDQLINNKTYRAAIEAQNDINKALKGFRAIFKSDEKVAKGRDINLVNAARAILASHGIGSAEKSARSYLEALKSYDSYTYESILPLVDDSLDSSVNYNDMTVEEFMAMKDKVDSLWKLSRRSKQIEIDGKLVDRKEVADELITRINELGLPAELPGYTKALTKWDKTKISLMGVRASLRRVEFWVDAMDGSKSNVFRKYIWNPISEAAADYRVKRVGYLQKYLDITKGIEKTLDNSKIQAHEINYTFNGKAELLGALLHTGNNSNLTKLLLGRKWGEVDENGMLDVSRWQSFLDRMYREGKLVKADMDFVQSVWDLLEEMKPGAQKAHFDMYGYYFNEITANPVNTPFGEYRGGYMPAVADPFINTDAAARADKDALEQDGNSYMFPTTGKGFTKGRVAGYNKPLALDLRYIPSHIDKVLKFTHIEPHIKDVGRLVTSGEFRNSLDALDPTVASDMLVPWLQRTAQQMVETPSKSKAGKAADWVFRTVRRNTGLQMMVGNIVNTLQQATGLSMAAVKVDPKYLRNALWKYTRQPTDIAETISEKSDFMKTRMTAQSFEIQKTIDDMLLNPSTYEKARQFAIKHGYFMQAGFQNVIDTIVWTGAYDQAAEQGLDEMESIRAADSAVRQTQGSFSPEDVSGFETGDAFMRAFTQFYNYFNMQANLLSTEYIHIAREMGLRKGAGRALYVYVFGFMMPAVLAEVIAQALGGGLDDDDDDGYMDDIMSLFFGSQFRTVTAMIPGGNILNAGVNLFNDKWYDDKLTTSPSVSTLESTVRAPHSVYEAIVNDGSKKKAVKDTLTAIGMLTGTPVGVLGRPLGYLADENADPEDGWDFTRGLITGRDVAKVD